MAWSHFRERTFYLKCINAFIHILLFGDELSPIDFQCIRRAGPRSQVSSCQDFHGSLEHEWKWTDWSDSSGTSLDCAHSEWVSYSFINSHNCLKSFWLWGIALHLNSVFPSQSYCFVSVNSTYQPWSCMFMCVLWPTCIVWTDELTSECCCRESGWLFGSVLALWTLHVRDSEVPHRTGGVLLGRNTCGGLVIFQSAAAVRTTENQREVQILRQHSSANLQPSVSTSLMCNNWGDLIFINCGVSASCIL